MTRPSPIPPGVRGDASFSPDGIYRYWLERQWNKELPQFTYVLLNPSAAGSDHDDPTSRRLRSFTEVQGGGGYQLVNLFALVDTDQVGLHHPRAIGESLELADQWIARAVDGADVVVLGWGDGNGRGPDAAHRKAAVRRRGAGVWPLVRACSPQCFTTTNSGAPGHPLYLKTATDLSDYVPGTEYLSDTP